MISLDDRGSLNPRSIPVGLGIWNLDSRKMFSYAMKFTTAVAQNTVAKILHVRILLVISL